MYLGTWDCHMYIVGGRVSFGLYIVLNKAEITTWCLI